MQYNVCETCGANNGRAGLLINGECLNCYETKKTGDVHIHTVLRRSEEELKKTIAIINNLPPC